MTKLPALVVSADILPNGGPLNGRRSAGQTLLGLWAQNSTDNALTVAAASQSLREPLASFVKTVGYTGSINIVGLTNADQISPHGALFLPDPSIGRWASFRNSQHPLSFSLIGQIHTLGTPAVMTQIEELASENVYQWDAIICSSHAGRSVVEAVLNDRENHLRKRFSTPDNVVIPRPQLPVIPLPVACDQIKSKLPPSRAARTALNIPSDHKVVLWLGRLSILTKSDPWPTYLLLQELASRIDNPLTFIECGPDDTTDQAANLASLRALCPAVNFIRLGSTQPVVEDLKLTALAAADVFISLVDNTQETFGLSVAEAMSAGLPSVVSNWDGYRDLVRNGIDGFLIPTKWSSLATVVSPPLGLDAKLGLLTYPQVAGCLAQLVHVDTHSALDALITLLTSPSLAKSMGIAAQKRASTLFASTNVFNQYQSLFDKLGQIRQEFSKDERLCKHPTPISTDPVAAFSAYPSNPPSDAYPGMPIRRDLPNAVSDIRSFLWRWIQDRLPQVKAARLRQEITHKHLQSLEGIF